MGTINYSRTGDVIEIILRDYSGRKVEKLTCTVRDRKRYAEILDYLRDKYGFEPKIGIDKSVPSSQPLELEEVEETNIWGFSK